MDCECIIVIGACWLISAHLMSGCYFSALGHSCDQFLKGVILIMEKVLEFLKTLMHSTDHDTVKINKNTLCDIKTYLQYTQEKL